MITFMNILDSREQRWTAFEEEFYALGSFYNNKKLTQKSCLGK